MNILLCSIGRRPYLVQWFKDALADNGLAGKVLVADPDPISPVRAFADEFIHAPRVSESGYETWLKEVLVERDVALAISIDEFELWGWSLLPREEHWGPLLRLTPESQRLVEDKYAMSEAFSDSDIQIPQTALARHALQDLREEGQFVVKGRFSTGSRGLRYTHAGRLQDTLRDAIREASTSRDHPAFAQGDLAPGDLVIVQDRIVGTEYGLDIVSDLDNEFAAVLARRKISMREGETDRAESVDPEMFVELGRTIAAAVPHPGSIDVDVIVDTEGTPFLIDINPRFGGGYPFSQLAGARVPHCYVAWTAGQPVQEDWLRTTPGVVSGKYVGVTRIR